jgi:hypothetical protein
MVHVGGIGTAVGPPALRVFGVGAGSALVESSICDARSRSVAGNVENIL